MFVYWFYICVRFGFLDCDFDVGGLGGKLVLSLGGGMVVMLWFVSLL